MSRCPECREDLSAEAERCRHCGAHLHGRPPQSERASPDAMLVGTVCAGGMVVLILLLLV